MTHTPLVLAKNGAKLTLKVKRRFQFGCWLTRHGTHTVRHIATLYKEIHTLKVLFKPLPKVQSSKTNVSTIACGSDGTNSIRHIENDLNEQNPLCELQKGKTQGTTLSTLPIVC